MNLDDYTSFDQVRATLGVSDEEVEDVTLSLEVYAIGLEEDLDSFSHDAIQTYMGIVAMDEDSRSVKEARVFRLVRIFSTYSVAQQLGSALPMLSPKAISDGKASMSRFSGEPYKKVLERLSEQYDLYRGRLIAALEDLSSSVQEVAPRVVMLAAEPAYDPVTGT